MVDEEKLYQAMKGLGMKRRAIASEIGISENILYNKLYGMSEFKAGEIMKLSKLLGLTRDQRDEIFFKE